MQCGRPTLCNALTNLLRLILRNFCSLLGSVAGTMGEPTSTTTPSPANLCWIALMLLVVHIAWLIGLTLIGVMSWSVVVTLQNHEWSADDALYFLYGCVLIIVAASCLSLACVVCCGGISAQLFFTIGCLWGCYKACFGPDHDTEIDGSRTGCLWMMYGPNNAVSP